MPRNWRTGCNNPTGEAPRGLSRFTGGADCTEISHEKLFYIKIARKLKTFSSIIACLLLLHPGNLKPFGDLKTAGGWWIMQPGTGASRPPAFGEQQPLCCVRSHPAPSPQGALKRLRAGTGAGWGSLGLNWAKRRYNHGYFTHVCRSFKMSL